MSTPTPYLEGIRVLDFTQYLAGPACTRLLTEMGAEVIKVEMAPHGEPTRAQEPRINRRASYFVQQNRGKRSLCLDLRKPEAVQVIKDLIPQIDVVVENSTPGVMARRGLGYDDLRAINPRIIMASISGFGQTGPMASKTAFDFIAQAYSGVMHMTGEPDGPPLFVGTAITDVGAGVHAFGAIGYALFRRDRTGEGSHIDIGMVDSLYHMQEMAVHAPSVTNGAYKAMRSGRHYGAAAPAGSFHSPQGWIVIFCTQAQVAELFKAMGRPELKDDPRFAMPQARLDNRDALTAIIEDWMAHFATDAEVMAILERHRIPCGQVMEPKDLGTIEHFRQRGTVRTVTDPLAGTFDIPGFPLKFSDAPPERDLVTPNLGEANEYVLRELLGYEADRVAAFEQGGVTFAKDR